MKKIIPIAAIAITVLAIASCGSSRKYGCPSTAKNSTTTTIKV